MNKFLHVLVLTAMICSLPGMAQESWPRFRNGLSQTGYTNYAGPLTNNEMWISQQSFSSIVSSPAVVEGKVYFGSMDSSVYCISSSDGQLIWSYHTAGPIYYSSPAVTNGKVYIGSWDGFLYCLDAGTGDFIWSFNTQSATGFNSCPAVADDKVYFGSNNSYVYCLDANSGDQIWSYKTGMSVWCSPAVVDGRLYIGSFDGKMRCLDAATGDSIWAAPLLMAYSSPAVEGDKLYFGSLIGGVAYCLNIADGSVVWQRPLNGMIFSSPAVTNGRVFIGVDQLPLNGGSMYCLDALTGDSLWCNFHSNEGTIYSSPAVTDSLVYYGSRNFHAFCVRQSTGEIIWDYETSNQILTSPAIVDNKVFFGTNDGLIVCIRDLDVGLDENLTTLVNLDIFPNPVIDRAHVNFTLSQSSAVHISIFDLQGRSVATICNQKYPSGEVSLTWYCRNAEGIKVPPGIYFCRLMMNQSVRTEKIIIY